MAGRKPLFQRVKSDPAPAYEPTGWSRVDRTQTEMRSRLASAKTEEQFQGIGLLGRELLISVAEVVFKPADHPTLDGTAASKTDAKRMLEAYIAVELGGSANEFARKPRVRWQSAPHGMIYGDHVRVDVQLSRGSVDAGTWIHGGARCQTDEGRTGQLGKGGCEQCGVCNIKACRLLAPVSPQINSAPE
jgi:hypothetical protein